ncbi:MAG: TonB-dependent receptor [Bacteroidales bacterium]|jgi:TonB-linked SusC/RagA family outer membrane protein|nr:TonB-dependent receptor [Bacteroidales bacterium]
MAQGISMKMKNVTVKQAMTEFTSESGYSFVFSSDDLNTGKKVSVLADRLDEAIEQILAGQSVSYEIRGKNIVLRRKDPVPATGDKDIRKVTGVVKDQNGETVIGANVVEYGTSNGTVTDSDGRFVLSVKKTGSLQFSCIGFLTLTVKVGNQSDFNIILKENTQVLDQVVVVAFGKMKREAFTGSAGILESGDLGKAQVSNPAEALAGRVAGVQLSNSSSQLGSSPSITIRGFGSISSGTQPLIVVDGMPYDGDLNLINPNDIESMTVLKDAASNALYGARGANGVIMITTKRGKSGDAKISVDVKWGVNSNGLNNYKTTDARQFYETYYKMLYNYYVSDDGGAMSTGDAHNLANTNLTSSSGGVGPGYMVYSVPSGEDFILQGGTMNPDATMGAIYDYNGQQFYLQADDWEKIGLKNGFRQEYNTTVSGASDRMNYYASLGYLDQDGIQEGSNQTRLTARVKTDYQARKWLKIGTNFNYSKYEYSQTAEGTIGTGTIWSTIKTKAPIYPVYLRNADKEIMVDKWGENMYDFANSYGLSRAGDVGGNCIFTNKYRTSKTTGNSCIASGYADVKLTDDLKFTFNASAYDYDRRYTYITSPFVDYYTDSSDNGYLSKSSSRTFTYNTQQLLNYSKRFGKHEVSAMLGHEYYDYKYEYLGASGYNFGIDGTYDLATCLNLNSNPTSYSSEYNNEGYFFRGMYNYGGKYYASMSYRRDASSRFAKEHRWGNFWSMGGAWVISKEPFFDVPWMNSLKIKASVGSQGNDNIGNYYYSDTYNVVNNEDEVAYQWRQKGSEDITWETNTNWNTGVEFELFESRLSGDLDFFYRKTSNMLFSLNTPPSIGYTSYFVNLGDMRNAGLELTLRGVLVNRKDFRWDVNFNISHVRNKVLRLPDEIKTTTVEGYNGYVNLDQSYVSKYKYFVAEGLSLCTWYLPKYAGVDPDTGEALYYKDVVDDDGTVTGRETTDDASQATDYLIGDALPDFYGGIGTTLSFHRFDFAINMNYQLGGMAYDYTYQTLMHTGGTSSLTWSVDMLKAWSSENTKSDIPRLRYAEKYSQNARSDRFLVNASYLNIQNVNVGYTLPEKLTGKFNVRSMRVYLSGENLFFVSARQGFDPRYTLMGYTNPELYSPIRTVSGGVTLTF